MGNTQEKKERNRVWKKKQREMRRRKRKETEEKGKGWREEQAMPQSSISPHPGKSAPPHHRGGRSKGQVERPIKVESLSHIWGSCPWF
jgi:hypothetical protein